MVSFIAYYIYKEAWIEPIERFKKPNVYFANTLKNLSTTIKGGGSGLGKGDGVGERGWG